MRKLFFDEAGFSMLELILYAAIVSILVAIAVPKYDAAVATANTARVQSDLQTLDSAIAMYYAQYGEYPKNVNDLSPYLSHSEAIKPPTGRINIKGVTDGKIVSEQYEIDREKGEAVLDNHGIFDFGSTKS